MITIASTFVAEPLEPVLGWLLREAGVDESVSFAPYHQVFQELLTPTSALRSNQNSASVILLRIEDYVRDVADKAAIDLKVDSMAAELSQAFEEFAFQAKAPIILLVFPPSPAVPESLVTKMVSAGELLARRAQEFPKVKIIDTAEVVGTEMRRGYDEVRDRLAHIPYTDWYYATVALALARAIHAAKNTPSKVLVLDCDNTLWRGVVGEDGVDGIQITAPYLQLQDFAIEQQRKGVLICLASKNTEGDVLNVLETRSDMHLKLKHIISHRINWLSKPINIRSLAEELNLGLDSFVFLDDNPVECAQMRAELPEVITLQIPEESDNWAFLHNLWMFDRLSVTAEDASRTQMYRENFARRAVAQSTSDIEAFIAALDMKIDIATPSDEEWPRLEQLTQRTNQFNFTTRRRSVSELRGLIRDGTWVERVRVADRFGDYGIVGLLVAQKVGTNLTVDTFLLSCRVLGRGVEHAMVRRLGKIAQLAGLEQVSLLHVPTVRNIPAKAFADSVAAQFASQSEAGQQYCVPAEVAALIEHQPGHDPKEVTEALAAEENKGAKPRSNIPPGRSERYSRLAHDLRSANAVLVQLAERPRRSRQVVGAVIGPASPVEEQLIRLWESLLEIDSVGIDDNFFDLGGTSLLSVSLFAEIARQFQIQLPLSAIVEAPTVRSLSRLMTIPNGQERQGLVCLRVAGPQKLFLVHDGLGETLLYHNLARRLPLAVSVYGIEPKRLPGIPLAHDSIPAMAKFYVEQIKQIQPRGPYLLGGMCAGGVIAYEIAAVLDEAGDSVQLVAILDGAAPQTQKKTGVITRRRLSNIKEAVVQRTLSQSSLVSQWASVASILFQKTTNAALYTIRANVHKISVRSRVALLKVLIKRGASWPKVLTPLNVQEIYDALESEYTPPALTTVPVLLVRASEGYGADTPFKELFWGDDLGWSRIARHLELVDVSGGHSSMLQEGSVDSLVAALSKHLGSVENPEASSA